jgi:hypothetical protein
MAKMQNARFIWTESLDYWLLDLTSSTSTNLQKDLGNQFREKSPAADIVAMSARFQAFWFNPGWP